MMTDEIFGCRVVLVREYDGSCGGGLLESAINRGQMIIGSYPIGTSRLFVLSDLPPNSNVSGKLSDILR
jgi:hypothetical protein